MKRNVYPTYLGDNRGADRPVEKPYQHIKARPREGQTGCFRIQATGCVLLAKNLWEIMAALKTSQVNLPAALRTEILN